MQLITVSILLLCLCAGVFAGCNITIDDVYLTCNSNYTTQLLSTFGNFSADTNLTVACESVEDLLNPIAACLDSDAAFDNCTEDEKHILEDELFMDFNLSCVLYDQCLVDFDGVLGELEECFTQFNDSLNTALEPLSEETINFQAVCNGFKDALDEVVPCFESAVESHFCSDKALHNLTSFFDEYDSFFNDTCGNEFFDTDILDSCDDPLTAFVGMAYCFGDLHDDYEFDEYGIEQDIELDADDCEEAFYDIYDSAVCTGAVIGEAGCNNDVSEELLALLLNATGDFAEVCGAELLEDLSLEGTTSAVRDDTSESSADMRHFSHIAMAIAIMVTMLLNTFH